MTCNRRRASIHLTAWWLQARQGPLHRTSRSESGRAEPRRMCQDLVLCRSVLPLDHIRLLLIRTLRTQLQRDRSVGMIFQPIRLSLIIDCLVHSGHPCSSLPQLAALGLSGPGRRRSAAVLAPGIYLPAGWSTPTRQTRQTRHTRPPRGAGHGHRVGKYDDGAC